MNALVVLGMVVVSVAVVSGVAYRIRSFYDLGGGNSSGIIVQDQSSLNEDFLDVLGFVPLDEVAEIVESFIKYDKQIGDVTVGYINDNARYIVREFQRMPEFQRFLSFLGNNGMDVGYWENQVAKYWEGIPTYVKSDTSVVCGGLSSMVNKIMETIPREELDEFLSQKIRYSASFRSFIEGLRSPTFEELCDAIEESKVLQRHYFWANDEGIEVIFGIELLKNLYDHFVYELQ